MVCVAVIAVHVDVVYNDYTENVVDWCIIIYEICVVLKHCVAIMVTGSYRNKQETNKMLKGMFEPSISSLSSDCAKSVL